MQKIIAWIKENKLSAILIAVVVFLFLGDYDSPTVYNEMFSTGKMSNRAMVGTDTMMAEFAPMPTAGGAPRLDIEDRKVSTNSNLSLVVQDVRESLRSIKEYAKDKGGYMVSAAQTSPEGLSNGNITIREPAEAFDSTLEYLRGYAIKVVSESVTGRDITDQYMDVEERLATLNNTKARYEEILDKAVDVNEILNVTQQILYIQDQIDSLTGRLEYLDATANSSLVTIYLSTDELELPFSPDQPWRPSLIFKYAVRSIVEDFRSLGELVIWAGVYAVFWIPALIVFFVLKKRRNTPR